MFGRKMGPTAFLDDGQGTMCIGFYHGGVGRYRHGRFECVFDCSGRNGLIESLYSIAAGACGSGPFAPVFCAWMTSLPNGRWL